MLYLVTNRKIKIKSKNYIDIIEDSIKGGVDKVILREKDLRHKELLELANRVKKVTDKYNTHLIINGNIDVAKKIDAYGYHCGFYDYIKSPNRYKIEGVSIHSVDEAIEAEKLGADYILAGHIFKTDCKKGLEARGISFLRKLKSNVDIPIIAIGGICPANIQSIKEVGVKNIAVMSYIMTSNDSYCLAKRLKEKL